MAGSGKSAIGNELMRRGYKLHDIENMEGFFAMIDKRTGEIIEYHNNDDLELVRQHKGNEKKVDAKLEKAPKNI